MAVLYIEEFAQPGVGIAQGMSAGKQPSNAVQTVAISGSHAESNAFKNNTHLIRVHTDAICSYAIGTSPTATSSYPRMAANQTEYFEVNPGDKLSVISNT